MLVAEQAKDPEVQQLIAFIERGRLPPEENKARKMALQRSLFTVVEGVLYYVDPKRNNRKRAVVPQHLQKRLLEETHAGPYGAHFSGQRMFNTLVFSWWWECMFSDASRFVKACPECAITTGVGRRIKPPLHPIPVGRPFQILGIDIMDLPLTDSGNKHVVVVQDLFTKWPFVFPVPDQRATRIAQLIAEEVIPWFGVPEALLSDRGANLLSHLVLDLCKLLGITKLNTSSYHPQCDGAVERFNRTLKQILRRHVARFGRQWDRYLPGILWAYRNTPHSSTGEKPSFLLFGVDLRTPSEAAYLPVSDSLSTTVEDYREELMISLSSARDLASEMIQKAQAKYKRYYDRQVRETSCRLGDWVLVHFPQEETGRNRKLSRPWHGPYRVLSKKDPNLTCGKVYFPQHGVLHVHQSRVCPVPAGFPAGYYWYGTKRKGPGRPPRWVDNLLAEGPGNPQDKGQIDTPEATSTAPDDRMQRDVDVHGAGEDSLDGIIHSTEGRSDPVEPTNATDQAAEDDAISGDLDQAAALDHQPAVSLEEVPTQPSAPSLPDSGLPEDQCQRQPQSQDTVNLKGDARKKKKAKNTPGTGSRRQLPGGWEPQAGVAGPQERDRRLRQVLRPPDRLV